MKTKPFDLEAAKNGAKVVTRDGWPVYEWTYFKEIENGYPVIAVIKGIAQTFTRDGRRFATPGVESPLDLLLAVETKTMYVNLYFDEAGDLYGYQYDTKQKAIDNADHGTARVIAQPIEIEQP